MGTAAAISVEPLKSAHSIARIVVLLMIALIPILVVSAFTDINEIRLLNALNDEESALLITMEEVEFHDFWYATFGYLQLLWFPALALFLIWFYKVYRNLPALGGTGLYFKPRWVIPYFFIPIVSFWKPYQATDEIWKVSDPAAITSDRVSRSEVGVSTVVIVWWIFWVISNIVGWYSLRQTFLAEESIESYLRMNSIYLVSEILSAISVGLTVSIVREIDKRQTKKIEVINSFSKDVTNASPLSSNGSDEDGQDFQSLKP